MEEWYPLWSYHVQNYAPLPSTLESLVQVIKLKNNITGRAFRVLLSNKNGQEPLVLSNIIIKAHGTTYELTVDGRSLVNLMPKEERYTDIVPISLSAGETIEITLTIPNETHLTGYAGLNSNQMIDVKFYTSRKDKHLREVVPEEISQVVKSSFNNYVYFGIRSLEILTDQKPYLITVFGDSIVHQGYWMNALFMKMFQNNPQVVICNEGISGNRVLRDGTSNSRLNDIFGEAGIKRFERDVYSLYHPDMVLIAEGINELVHPGNICPLSEMVSKEEVINGLDKLGKIAIKNNSIPVFVTLSPFYNYDGIWDEDRENIRQAVNSWIRSQKYFIDIDSIVSDKSHPECLSKIYDCNDHLHFNEKCGNEIADQIYLKIRDMIRKMSDNE